MFCESCGKKISDNSKFCEYCGASTEVDTVLEEVNNDFIQEEVHNFSNENNLTTSSNVKNYTVSQNIDTNSTPKKQSNKPKSSTGLIIAGVVVGVILVLGVSFFAFKDTFLKSKDAQASISNDDKVVNNVEIDKNSSGNESNKNNSSTTIKDNGNKNNTTTIKDNSNKSDSLYEDEPKEYKHKYELIQGNLNWEEAKDYCESLGGHLATITSKAEEREVLSLLDGSDVKVLWLGANDLNYTGNFKWITGETFTYANWAPNEPNNDQGIEHYLVLYKVEDEWLWNDGPLNTNEYYKAETIGFVCEWEVEE